jgi:uracil-DNA glycosylase family 4
MKEAGVAGSKAAQLRAVEDDLSRSTTLPLYEYRQKNGYHAVPGEGDPKARIMFIGEAPGKQEAMSGRPFVGRSGRLLDGLLASIGLERGQVYIANILKDRPPDNRPPHKDEIAQYTPFLLRQIAIIQPRLIATLGRFAMEFILEEFKLPELGCKISELHGQRLRGKTTYGPVTILPLYHPAVALYRRQQKETLENDFETLREYV